MSQTSVLAILGGLCMVASSLSALQSLFASGDSADRAAQRSALWMIAAALFFIASTAREVLAK